VLTTLLFACKKQSESFSTASLNDYYPLQVGKYITYNLDSTVFINFSTKDTIIKYQVKDSIDAQITDNLGRPAFRITRYIRKNAGDAWTGNNTFMAIPTENTIEFVENNLRFQKLKLPIVEGFTWKGNSYIETYNNFPYLDNWDYTYDSINAPITLGSLHIFNTIKVLQRDEFIGQDPNLSATLFAEKTYAVEKYAKDIGLVYKELIHWEYQGHQAASPGFTGYGVKLTMIDHN
jgi:hypothetical protein